MLAVLLAFLAGTPGLFDYDSKAPLDIGEKLLYERDGVKVLDITYASPKIGRVTAYLVLPAAKGPHAAIVFGHWGYGNRTEFLPEAELYAQAGAACIVIDYPWTRPAQWRREVNQLTGPDEDFDAFVQAVVDLRRAIDLMAARPEVDAKRIGYVGHSFGAQWGAILAAVDRRLRAAVLMAGVPDSDAIYRESDDPEIEDVRKQYGDKLQKWLEKMRPLSAINYVPKAAPTPLLFQFARRERIFNESAMLRYYEAASRPKQILWYDTGHELNDPRALADRARWLERELKLKPVMPVLLQRMDIK